MYLSAIIADHISLMLVYLELSLAKIRFPSNVGDFSILWLPVDMGTGDPLG